MLNKYEFLGQEKGKTLLILAAIHGNETAGTNACHKIIEEIKSGKLVLKSGKLTIVPICNEEAYKRDCRCVDENLNRVIKLWEEPQTYEQRLANEICPLIQENDVLLDLHSTHVLGDVPFAFWDYPSDLNKKIVENLPVEYVLKGWPSIYASQNEISDFSTERFAHVCGNVGTTLECGYHKSPEAIELAYRAIINTLGALSMIGDKHFDLKSQTHIIMKEFVLKKREGKLLKPYNHLDKVCKGEEIARYDDGEILVAKDNGYILLPNHSADIGTEWYYFGVAETKH